MSTRIVRLTPRGQSLLDDLKRIDPEVHARAEAAMAKIERQTRRRVWWWRAKQVARAVVSYVNYWWPVWAIVAVAIYLTWMWGFE